MALTEITIDGTRYHLEAIPNKPKEQTKQTDRITVENFCAQDIYGLITNGLAKYSNYLMFKFKGSISSTQIPLICKAIEQVLNDDKENMKYYFDKIQPTPTLSSIGGERLYTKEEMEEEYKRGMIAGLDKAMEIYKGCK
jgi:hypothetical protein